MLQALMLQAQGQRAQEETLNQGKSAAVCKLFISGYL
jgi:hypothetical protein